MADLAISIVKLLGALFLVGLNGFFVASEFAFVRIRESTVERLSNEGAFGAGILEEVMEELDDYLAVTQLGITVASIGLGWLGEPAVANLLEGFLGPYLPDATLHLVSFGIGFSLVTFMHVVFGELAPKTFSIQRTEKVAILVAVPMKFFRIIFIPGIFVFNGAANQFTELFGVEPASETEEIYTEEELRSVLSQSSKSGQVDEEEYEMIERVFKLDDIKVKEIMVPQPDAVTLSRDQNLAEVREMVKNSKHTRYPVVEDDGNEIFGFVDVKDVLQFGEEDEENVTVGDIMSDITIVPESATVNTALKKFKEDKTQMAAVIDEWGVFEGIVTAEDAVEVVVGDLKDKYDEEGDRPRIEENGDHYEADGSMTLPRLNEEIDTSFEREDVDTVAGIVMSETEEVPSEGDSVVAQGYNIEVVETDNNRIEKVRISKEDETEKDEEEQD